MTTTKPAVGGLGPEPDAAALTSFRARRCAVNQPAAVVVATLQAEWGIRLAASVSPLRQVVRPLLMADRGRRTTPRKWSWSAS